MKLVNMKISKKEAKKMTECCAVDAPEYPYGLRIELGNDALEKLGITALPGVGKKIMVEAVCEVCSVSQYENKDKTSNRSVSLQITDMSVVEAKEKKSVSDSLYGEK